MEDVKAAILSLRTGSENVENRTQSFGMRPEQFRAVEQAKSYFEQAVKEEPNRIPKFLWNAKMRFGKTFASYQLAKKNESVAYIGPDFQTGCRICMA